MINVLPLFTTIDENLLEEAVADEPEMVMIDYDELMLTGYGKNFL